MKTNVIIPVKNHNNFLGTQTIQNEVNVKYIFVIDLSSNSKTIEKSKILNNLYPKKNIEVYYVDFQNINKSFNFGLSKIDDDCEFISVMEDDYHYPYKLEKQVLFLQENKDIGILGSNHFAVDLNEGMRHESHQYKETHNEIISRYFFDIAMCGPMFLIRRDVFNITDFGEEDMWCYYITNNLHPKYKLHNYQEYLSCYYRYSTSNSVIIGNKFNNYIIKNIDKNLKLLDLKDISAEELFYGIRLISPSVKTIETLNKIKNANDNIMLMPNFEFSEEIDYRIRYIKHYLKI